jgi:hypothetical protein
LPDVVTDKREFDKTRAAADQVRNMTAQGRPCYGVELASYHESRHARPCGNERRGREIRPARADAVQLPAVQPMRAGWKVLAIVRTIPALNRRMGCAVLYRSSCELGRKDLPKALRLAVVNSLDQVGQIWVGGRVIEQIGDHGLKQGGTVTSNGFCSSLANVSR